jgi:hypothetical protein
MKPILSSLADFIMAGLRPRTPLAKAIMVALAVKLVIIVSMKVFLFSGDAQPAVDDATMRRLIGPATSMERVPAAAGQDNPGQKAASRQDSSRDNLGPISPAAAPRTLLQ